MVGNVRLSEIFVSNFISAKFHPIPQPKKDDVWGTHEFRMESGKKA